MHDIPVVVAGNKYDLVLEDRGSDARKRIITMIKKTWKIPHVECSARYNWHVVLLFKELLKLIESFEHRMGGQAYTFRMQEAFGGERCHIL